MLAWLEKRHDELQHQHTVMREDYEATQAAVRIHKHELGRTRAELTALRATLGKLQRKEAAAAASDTRAAAAAAAAAVPASVAQPASGRRARSVGRTGRQVRY